MSRATAPTVHCDDEDCDAWAIDEYDLCVDSINGVRITGTHRAIGWTTVEEADFCPDHKPTEPEPSTPFERSFAALQEFGYPEPSEPSPDVRPKNGEKP